MSKGGGRVSFSRVLTVCLLILGSVILISYWSFFKPCRYTVSFKDAGLLEISSPVCFAGVKIGRVAEILPESSFAMVKIEIARKHQHLLTSASNFYIGSFKQRPALLVKNIGAGRPLTIAQTVVGVDSYIEWETLEYRHKLEQSEFWREVKVGVVDWDKLGADCQQKMEGLSNDLENFFNDPDVQKKILELDQKMIEIKEAISRAGNSEEAHQLYLSLEHAYEKLKKELGNNELPQK